MARPFKFKRAYTNAQKELVIEVLGLIRGLSNSEAARECGLSNGTVSKWRTRRTKCPSLSSALKVALANGRTLKIVDEEEKPTRGTSRARQRDELDFHVN